MLFLRLRFTPARRRLYVWAGPYPEFISSSFSFICFISYSTSCPPDPGTISLACFCAKWECIEQVSYFCT